MIESIPEEIKEKVSALTGVKDVDIEITFEPAWDKEMMSEEAKLQLGFLYDTVKKKHPQKSGTRRVPLFWGYVLNHSSGFITSGI